MATVRQRPGTGALALASSGWPDAAAGILAAAGAVAGWATAAAGAVLVARRLAGAIAAPADAGPAWAVTLAGAALVSLADRAAPRDRAAAWAARAGLAAGLLAVAVAPRSAGWSALASLAAAGFVAAVVIARPIHGRPRGGPIVAPRRPLRPSAPAARNVTAIPAGPRLAPADALLRQRLERYELPAGIDCLRGTVHLDVGVGSRAAHAHVGFCPAFTETPAVEVTTGYDGVEATVAAAEVLPWGVRVECRLAEPAEEPLRIPVDVIARAPA